MCTLIASVGHAPGVPLLIAANRDERLDRPSRGPFLWTEGKVPFLAPRDEVALGSWLGLNAHGLFVAVTNRAGVPASPTRRSRGALVIDALSAPSATALHAQLSTLTGAKFNAFHLLYADSTAAFVSWSDGERLRQHPLSPGLHVVTERSLGGDDQGREELIRRRWRERYSTARFEDLALLLSEHGQSSPIAGTCVHAEEFNYGTRSSLLLELRLDLGKSRLAWAAGPPCRHPHEELPALVASLHAQGAS